MKEFNRIIEDIENIREKCWDMGRSELVSKTQEILNKIRNAWSGYENVFAYRFALDQIATPNAPILFTTMTFDRRGVHIIYCTPSGERVDDFSLLSEDNLRDQLEEIEVVLKNVVKFYKNGIRKMVLWNTKKGIMGEKDEF